jgi:supervillin
VDPTQLETYLSDEDFVSALGMTRTEWAALPHWKKDPIKRAADLF